MGLLGCGPTVGTANTNTDTDTLSTTGTDETGSVDTSSGGAVSCEGFANEVSSGAVNVEIRNVGDTPLLFNEPCFSDGYVSLTTSAGWSWPSGFCAQTCEAEFLEGCIVCDGCAIAAYNIVAPGDALTVSWSGLLYEQVDPPDECFGGQRCSESCAQARTAVDPVTVSVEAITQADCLAAEVEPASCDCADPDAPECSNYGSEWIEPTITAEVIWQPGTSGPIVLELAG